MWSSDTQMTFSKYNQYLDSMSFFKVYFLIKKKSREISIFEQLVIAKSKPLANQFNKTIIIIKSDLI